MGLRTGVFSIPGSVDISGKVMRHEIDRFPKEKIE
jgi:hypothetical protein